MDFIADRESGANSTNASIELGERVHLMSSICGLIVRIQKLLPITVACVGSFPNWLLGEIDAFEDVDLAIVDWINGEKIWTEERRLNASKRLRQEFGQHFETSDFYIENGYVIIGRLINCVNRIRVDKNCDVKIILCPPMKNTIYEISIGFDVLNCCGTTFLLHEQTTRIRFYFTGFRVAMVRGLFFDRGTSSLRMQVDYSNDDRYVSRGVKISRWKQYCTQLECGCLTEEYARRLDILEKKCRRACDKDTFKDDDCIQSASKWKRLFENCSVARYRPMNHKIISYELCEVMRALKEPFSLSAIIDILFIEGRNRISGH